MRMNAMWVLIPLVSVVAEGAQAPRVGKQDPNPPKSDQTIVTPPKPSDPNVGMAGVNPNSYQIGGEDVIFIKTWRQPDFTFTTAVRPDGKITIPLVGEMTAGGKTPSQLEKELSKALGTYIQNPDVTITVVDVRSKKYFIIGEVLKAGQFALVGPTTVMEAVSQCGFAPFANRKKIRILRGDKTYIFNFEEVSKGKKMEQNIPLENGDYVIVK
jgi:polysaccharide export outer membrane protein